MIDAGIGGWSCSNFLASKKRAPSVCVVHTLGNKMYKVTYFGPFGASGLQIGALQRYGTRAM